MNWFCQTTKRWKTEGYGSSGVILWTNMATTGTNRGRFLLLACQRETTRKTLYKFYGDS